MKNTQKLRYLAAMIPALWVAACGSGNAGSSNQTQPPCNPCAVFVTESLYTGNILAAATALGYSGQTLGAVSGVSTGIYAADWLCNQDESKPNNGTYKAFLVDNVNRYACTTLNCLESSTGAPVQQGVDWVLHPNTPYQTITESILFTTNVSSIYTFGVLQTYNPSPNIPAGGPKSHSTYWTGFSYPLPQTTSSQWVAPSAVSCNSFTGTSGDGGNGWFYGSDSAKPLTNPENAASFIGAESSGCTKMMNLLCVQQ